MKASENSLAFSLGPVLFQRHSDAAVFVGRRQKADQISDPEADASIIRCSYSLSGLTGAYAVLPTMRRLHDIGGWHASHSFLKVGP